MFIAVIALALVGFDDQNTYTYFTGIPDWVRLVSVHEYHPRTSDVVDTGQSPPVFVETSDRHVLAFKFELVMDTLAYPNDTIDHSIGLMFPGEAPYDEPGVFLAVDNDPAAPGDNDEGPGVGVNTFGYSIGTTVLLYLPIPTAGPPQTANFTFFRQYGHYQSQNHFHYDFAVWQAKIDIDKVYVTDAAIDTRKAYGQPNRDGQVFADPNSDLRNVWFGNWFWSGGLFAGHMPESYKDRSGFARVQFWPVTAVDETTVLFSTLTLLDLDGPLVNTGGSGGTGGPPGGGGPGTGGGTSGDAGSPRAKIPPLGVYIPAEDDPNIGWVEADVYWSRGWEINPGEPPSGGGPPGNPDEPVSVTIDKDFDPWDGTSETGGDYINWSITFVDTSLNPLGNIYTTPAFNHGLLLAMVDEQVFENDQNIYWRYFASREFEAQFPNDFPRNDSRPRVWALTVMGSHNWNPFWVQT